MVSEVSTRQIELSAELDERLERIMPPYLRGPRRTRARVEHALTQFLESLESGSVSGGINGVKTQPGRDVIDPTNQP